MTSPFRDLPLRPRAIALLKEGHTPEAIHVQFVSEGADPEEVRSVLTELVALLHQAAAMDPKRLRGEAMWMFMRRARIDDVVAHFVRAGVAEAHARPEVQRLYADFQRLRPCQRCGTPADPGALVFDSSGFSICNGCNLQDEIGRSEHRGAMRDLETIGALGGMGGSLVVALAANAMGDGGQYATTRPFCAYCRQPSGVHLSALRPDARARVAPGSEWVCSQCGQRIA